MRALVLCLAVVGLGVAAPVAAAGDAAFDTFRHDGPADARSPGPLTCAGGTATPTVGPAEVNPHLGRGDVNGVGAGADVRVPLWIDGADGCAASGGLRARIEALAPPRTVLLHNADYPVDCYGGAALTDVTACRAAYSPGAFGGLFVDDARGTETQAWTVTGDAAHPTYVSFPVVYMGVIDSFGSSTEQRCGAVGVCAARAADGRVQVVVTFLPAGVGTPAAPVYTTVGVPAGGDDDCCQDIEPDRDTRPVWYPSRPLPSRVTRGELRRGYRFAVHVRKRTTVTVRLTKGSTTIASAKIAGRKDGVRDTVLKLGPKALRRLGSSATLTVRRTGGTTNLMLLTGKVRVTGR
ncbi:MAG TPA: hypothetical protein VI318_26235 [Baekduia sp.]